MKIYLDFAGPRHAVVMGFDRETPGNGRTFEREEPSRTINRASGVHSRGSERESKLEWRDRWPTTKNGDAKKGLTRRQFMSSVGATAAIAAVSGKVTADEEREGAVLQASRLSKITLIINGRRHKLLVEPRWSLLYVLRERLGLTGTKVGCERGECGACTVLIDGIPEYACMTLAVEAEGASVTALEGLMNGDELGPVQQAFLEEDAFFSAATVPRARSWRPKGSSGRTRTRAWTRSAKA
jgi:hypothetical protein